MTFRKKGWDRVQKLEDISNNKSIIYEVNPVETFIGKSQLCNMTEFSGARDKEVFDGNTILLKVSEENNKHRYVYIGGDMVCSFLTNDRIYKYISNMGNNLTPYSIAKSWENIYYLTPDFKFTKKENIDENEIDKVFDYQNISNCRKLRVYIKFIQTMINNKIEVHIQGLKNYIYLFYHQNSRFLYILLNWIL